MASFTDQLSKFFGMNDTDTSLRELFISELKGIYYAEKQFADALPNMAEAATTDVVRNAFQQHAQETDTQISRLEQIFRHLDIEVDEKTCNAADGLVDDGDVVIADTDSGSITRDAGLILAGQKVEHHEIASYGSLHSLARLLGYHEVAQLIEQSLEEEKTTDRKLTEIAESFINERAKMESDDNNDLHNSMRDTVREGDYGDTNYRQGSSYSGVTGSGTEEEYAAANTRRTENNRTAGGYSTADDAEISNNSTYGTGADQNRSSSTNRDDDDSNPFRRSTPDPTAGGPLGV